MGLGALIDCRFLLLNWEQLFIFVKTFPKKRKYRPYFY
ncbi:hypothetical protein GARC_4663 [Paraglaciecola arctica BSs20135]|uniref:Uncharacterized protein n=1 Tax=Paraglaciecola arctica BSs20135 TaxID=493475 RepID=K6ZDW1_9ALTE|nr:hypothetical protein GARC_4663 [Paraglaciecola arctica BSs20135]